MTSVMAHHLLRFAASRWPDDIANEMHYEWRAELYAIANEPQPSSLGKIFEQLRFAFSLAISPPGGEKTRVGIRERSRRMKPALTMMGLGTLVGVIALAPLLPALLFVDDNARVILDLAIAFVLAAVLGNWAASRMSKREHDPWKSRWALPLVIGVSALLTPLVTNVLQGNRFSNVSWVILGSALVWMAALVPLVMGIKRTLRRGYPRLARWGGAIAGLITVYLISIPLQLAVYWVHNMFTTPATEALVWFPKLFWGIIWRTENLVANLWVTHVVITFLMATVFIVWYLTRKPSVATNCEADDNPGPDATSRSGGGSEVDTKSEVAAA